MSRELETLEDKENGLYSENFKNYAVKEEMQFFLYPLDECQSQLKMDIKSKVDDIVRNIHFCITDLIKQETQGPENRYRNN